MFATITRTRDHFAAGKLTYDDAVYLLTYGGVPYWLCDSIIRRWQRS